MTMLNNQAETSGIVTSAQVKIIDVFNIVCVLLIATGGIVTNLINITTFIRMGVKDSVTLSLLHLALSDLAICVTAQLTTSSLAAQQVELWNLPIFDFDPLIITLYSANYGEMFYLCTSLTTTMITVARCACLAKPLHFKNTFTWTRTAITLAILDIFAVVNFTPILVGFETPASYETHLNKTRRSLHQSTVRDRAQDVKSAVVDTAAATISQIIIIVCIIIMVIKLREVSKFRQLGSSDHTKSSGNKMSPANYHVLQQIILISLSYMLCNTPKILIAVVRMAVPGFDVGRQFHDLFVISYKLKIIFEVLDCVITFLIYYKFSTKFRENFWKQKKSMPGAIGT